MATLLAGPSSGMGSLANLGFPRLGLRVGAQTIFFPENRMKMKEIGLTGGGGAEAFDRYQQKRYLPVILLAVGK